MKKDTNAFDITVSALRDKGLNSEEILKELSKLFQAMSANAETTTTIPEGTTEDKEKKLKKLLLATGIPRNLSGYHYLISAILLYQQNPAQSMTKELYVAVAQKHGTTPVRAERAMRHAIESAFNRCDTDVIYKFFGETLNPARGKPTNSEFITRYAELLQEE